MAHNISLNLDGDGIAEMSCVSGVVGKVGPIMDLANSGRPIIAIDGCALSCTRSCLEASGLSADYYYQISDLGFEKRSKWNDSLTENTIAMKSIYDKLFEEGIGFNKKKYFSLQTLAKSIECKNSMLDINISLQISNRKA